MRLRFREICGDSCIADLSASHRIMNANLVSGFPQRPVQTLSVAPGVDLGGAPYMRVQPKQAANREIYVRHSMMQFPPNTAFLVQHLPGRYSRCTFLDTAPACKRQASQHMNRKRSKNTIYFAPQRNCDSIMKPACLKVTLRWLETVGWWPGT